MMFGPEGAEHGKKGGQQPSHGKDFGGKGDERTIERKRTIRKNYKQNKEEADQDQEVVGDPEAKVAAVSEAEADPEEDEKRVKMKKKKEDKERTMIAFECIEDLFNDAIACKKFNKFNNNNE